MESILLPSDIARTFTSCVPETEALESGVGGSKVIEIEEKRSEESFGEINVEKIAVASTSSTTASTAR